MLFQIFIILAYILCILDYNDFILVFPRYQAPLVLCTVMKASKLLFIAYYAFRIILILQVSIGALHYNTLPVHMSQGERITLYFISPEIYNTTKFHVGKHVIESNHYAYLIQLFQVLNCCVYFVYLRLYLVYSCGTYVSGFFGILYCHGRILVTNQC